MVINLSLRRPGSEPKLVCVVFEVEEVAVGHISVQVLGSFYVGNITPILHFVNLIPTLYGRRNSQASLNKTYLFLSIK